MKKGEIATIIGLGALIILGLSSLVSSFVLNKKQTTKTKAAQNCDCPWPGIKKPDGSCEYGLYDVGNRNPYFVDKGHNLDYCLRYDGCVEVQYNESNRNPLGGYGVCRFSNSNVCRRYDFQGGCGGMCNWECCTGGSKMKVNGADYDSHLTSLYPNLCQIGGGSGSSGGGSGAGGGSGGNPGGGSSPAGSCASNFQAHQQNRWNNCLLSFSAGTCVRRNVPGDPYDGKYFYCNSDGQWGGPCDDAKCGGGGGGGSNGPGGGSLPSAIPTQIPTPIPDGGGSPSITPYYFPGSVTCPAGTVPGPYIPHGYGARYCVTPSPRPPGGVTSTLPPTTPPGEGSSSPGAAGGKCMIKTNTGVASRQFIYYCVEGNLVCSDQTEKGICVTPSPIPPNTPTPECDFSDTNYCIEPKAKEGERNNQKSFPWCQHIKYGWRKLGKVGIRTEPCSYYVFRDGQFILINALYGEKRFNVTRSDNTDKAICLYELISNDHYLCNTDDYYNYNNICEYYGCIIKNDNFEITVKIERDYFIRQFNFKDVEQSAINSNTNFIQIKKIEFLNEEITDDELDKKIGYTRELIKNGYELKFSVTQEKIKEYFTYSPEQAINLIQISAFIQKESNQSYETGNFTLPTTILNNDDLSMVIM